MTSSPAAAAVSESKSALVQVCLAGVSNALAAAATNPIDVVKIRLQLHGVCLRTGVETTSQQLSVMNGFSTLVRTEGISGLYRGLSASLCREMSYSGIRMGLYEPTKNLVGKTLYSDPSSSSSNTSLSLKVLSGALTGCFGSAIANPLDLVKCRMQSYDGAGGRTSYVSVISALRQIRLEGGIRKGLWRGTFATVQRATLLTASQVPSYDHVKHYILDSGYMKEGYLCHFACSMVAGVVTAAVTSPVDLIKSRLMIQPVDQITGKGVLYKGTVDCLVRVVRTEGPLALFKGFHTQWLRIGPHTTISLMAFEQLRRCFGMNYL